jgi:uncharacterized protein (TIGR02246 family)
MTPVFVFAWCALWAGAAQAQLVPGWINDRTEQWYGAFNAGDAAAMGRLYAPDAVLALQGEVYTGRPAIEAFHRMNFATARFECTYAIKGTSVVDKVAAVWGDDACTDTPKRGGPSEKWQGRWLTVYQLEPDGNWLIVRDSAEDARPSAR